MDSTFDTFAISAALLVALVMLGLFIWSLVWVYRDAERRGKPPLLVTLMVAFLSWPISLLVWLVFRPDEKSPQ